MSSNEVIVRGGFLVALAVTAVASGCGTEGVDDADVDDVEVVRRAEIVTTCPSGKKCMNCYDAAVCDRDGDTFADEECATYQLWAYTDKRICPAGLLEFTEPRGCDRTTGSKHMDFARPGVSSATVTSTLASRHTHGIEVANNLDDDCDRMIDEAIVDYSYQNDAAKLGDGAVNFSLTINDTRIPSRANWIYFRMYRLGDLDNEGSLRALAQTESYNVAAVPCNAGWLQYAGQSTINVTMSQCSAGSGDVYVVAGDFWYYPPRGGAGTQLRCFKADGTVDDFNACPWSAVVYTEPVIQADYKIGAATIYRTRSLAVNQALYEWFLSDTMGLVGGSDIGPSLFPAGTRYGADYGERWCSEFSSRTFNVATPDIPNNLTNVTKFVTYFSDRGTWVSGSSARTALSSGTAKFGDYLGMNTSGILGDKSHSGIFLAYSPSADGVWRVAGNEGNYVGLEQTGRLYKKATEDKDWYHIGVGRLTNQRPRN